MLPDNYYRLLLEKKVQIHLQQQCQLQLHLLYLKIQLLLLPMLLYFSISSTSFIGHLHEGRCHFTI